jgi:two-component sensor histidine kinase/HPt (histidine-containing phosphotransfer) domain-containing protein
MAFYAVLPEEAVKNQYLRMSRRTIFSGPFLAIAAAMVLQTHPIFWQETIPIICFSIIICGIFYRTPLHLMSHRILNRPNGLSLFRKLFAIAALVPALAFGILAAYVAFHSGVGFETTASLACIVGIMSMSTLLLAFDLAITLILQATVFWPSTLVMTLYFHSHTGIWEFLSVMSIFYAVMGAFGLNQNKMIIQEVTSYESLRTEKERYRAAHAEAHDTNQMVTAMFASVAEGFLIFNHQGFCIASPSVMAAQIFGLDPVGKHISEILRLNQEDKEEFDQWFQVVFEGRIPFQVLAETRDKSMKIDGRTLQLKYHVMLSEAEKINGVVMTAADISLEAAAQRLAQDSADRAELILRVHENKKEFRGFLNDFERVITALQTWDGKDIDGLRRDLHTLKGAAAIFGARGLSRRVHEGELMIIEALAKSGNRIVNVHHVITELGDRFNMWRANEMNLFAQLGVFETENVEISDKHFAEIEARYHQNPAVIEALHDLRNHASVVELGELFQNYAPHIHATAKKLGKRAELSIERSGEEIFVHPQAYRDVLRSLIHLFNNALDHGIEPPAERLLKDKDENGKIKIEYSRRTEGQKRQIVVRVIDDGRGIDVVRLRRAIARSDANAALLMTDDEITQSIFYDGLSSRERINDISGQGIGMGAVRASILKARGQIKVSQTSELGTEFEIVLPDLSLLGSKAASRKGAILAKAN